ncbi:MAG: P-loop NTPase [Cyanobacteria bacterium REEB67]|nr:P-loop NTPase [Cyanobacteria bacterium REEB67]
MLKKIFGLKQKQQAGQTGERSQSADAPGADHRGSESFNLQPSLALEPDRSAAAPLIGVLGARGGVGTSTIAFNLAASLAASGVDTTIVDADFQLPDIANLIGQEAEHSILELLGRGAKTDRLLFQACRLEIPCGSGSLGGLLPPADGEAAIKSNLTELGECLDHISSFSSLFVIDLPNHLDRHLVTILDRCAKIVLAFEATISGVAACQQWLSIFAELGYEEDRVMLVCNRSGSKHKLVEDQLPACFVGRTTWKVTNASSLVGTPAQQGVPLALSSPNSAYARSVAKLAAHLQGALIDADTAPASETATSKKSSVNGFSSVALSR